MQNADIGLIGLGVMGQNLARNIARNKYPIVVYNRTTEKMTSFIREYGNENLFGEETLEAFVSRIKRPRSIIILVKAGGAVDAVINGLLPLLEEGDTIIEAGNSNYRDTIRRKTELKSKGIELLGMGVSGGEEGALNGPSLMPGGEAAVYQRLAPILESISARDFAGKPCVTFIGENGAGHYVKMVHNGIEYSVMQMMSEAYDLLRKMYNLSASAIADIFADFNTRELDSYLFEISIPILRKMDNETHTPLVDLILDKAGQKGTGRWTAIDALERGVAIPSITESVFARNISSKKPLRTKLSHLFQTQNNAAVSFQQEDFIQLLENALYAGMLSSYGQGFDLIQVAAKEEEWTINLAEIARIWEGGCIIRAQILNFIHDAFLSGKSENHLFEIPSAKHALEEKIQDLRHVVSLGTLHGIPLPSLASGLSYFESMTTQELPANFIQALRDYFGAHTYERTDKEGTFHTQWSDES